MNRYRRLLVSTLTLAFLALPLMGWPMERFVSPTGSDAAPYTNWATAARTIQAAVDAATTGDVVWVTNGVYAAAGTNCAYGDSHGHRLGRHWQSSKCDDRSGGASQLFSSEQYSTLLFHICRQFILCLRL